MPVCTASTRANIHMQLWNIQVSLDWGGSLGRLCFPLSRAQLITRSTKGG